VTTAAATASVELTFSSRAPTFFWSVSRDSVVTALLRILIVVLADGVIVSSSLFADSDARAAD